MNISYKEIIVENPRIKQTIYSYLKMNGYSENYLKNLRKELGYILLNDKPVFINKIIKQDDIIRVNVNPNTKSSIMSCIIPLDIVFEDDNMLIINKPANIATMPSRSHFAYNLSGAILGYMEKTDTNFVVRIVNRLDKETAGFVIVAKNSLSSNFLNHENNTQKTYYALCSGNLDKDIVIDKNIDTILGGYGYNQNKRIISQNGGKKAKTFVEVVKNYRDYFLAKIKLEHGRTHQIRVHMSSIGHSLIGDSLYGEKSDLISHTALVCKEMDVVNPETEELMHFEIPFPDDFDKLVRN